MSTKIYTKTGDHGETSLLGGTRVKKHGLEMQAIGDVDELNASIGFLISLLPQEDTHREILEEVQHRLFDVGSLLAASRTDLFQLQEIEEHDVLFLEQWIDQMHEELPPLTQFILPGGTPAAAQSFFIRAVCRRAERSVVALGEEVKLNIFLRQYLNRLSDALFVFGRWLNAANGEGETVWKKKENRQ